jgi:hypothetical protein
VLVRPLSVVAFEPEEVAAEGCATPEMFEQVWRSVNGGRFDAESWVWTYRFDVTRRQRVFLEGEQIPARTRRTLRDAILTERAS